VPKAGSGLSNIVVSFTYHPLFNKALTAVDGKGQTTTYTYDAATGNLLTVQQPQVGGQTPTTTFTYNARGQILTVTDPTGIVSKINYHATLERISSMVADFGTGRLNLTTSFGYNTRGDITSVTDPRANVTTIAYDVLRRQTQVTAPSPFSYVTKMTYDDNGNVTKVERQTNIVATPWQTVNMTYSFDNKILTQLDPSNDTSTYVYNNLRQLQQFTDPASRVTQYTYDDAGRLSTVKDPTNVVALTKTYTDNGLVATTKDSRNNLTSYSYDGFDRAKRRTFPNSLYTEVTSYDANSNVLSVRNRDASTVTFTYDALNRVATKAPSSMPTVTYTYDLADRLLTASKPVVGGDASTGTFTISYDTAGRAYRETYPDGKQFTNVLDANGNVTKTTWPDGYFVDRVYDKLNRLTDIKLNGSATAAATYTWMRSRVRPQLPGRTLPAQVLPGSWITTWRQ